MSARAPFKRLILRAVLRNVSPMVIRVVAVSDSLSLHELDEVFRSVLDWENIGFIFHMQGLEFSSFRRATRSRTLREFQLRCQTQNYLILPQVWCNWLTGNGKTRARNSSNSARPYICRFRVFRRFIWPSTGPLLQACSTALDR